MAWWGVYFSLGLVISALFWSGKRNFDSFWAGFKIFDRFRPVTKLTANYKDCKPNHLFLRIDHFMVNLDRNREKCFISFTGLSLFSNCHWAKNIFLKIWPDQWNYAKIVNGSVTGQGLTRPLRQGCINTADIINFERRYLYASLLCKNLIFMQNMMKKRNYFLTRFFPKLSLSTQCCFWATLPKITKKLDITEQLQFDLSVRAKNITFSAGLIFFANHTENWAVRGKEIGKQINGNFRNICEGLWIINLVFNLAKIRLNLYFLYIYVNQKRFQAEHDL